MENICSFTTNCSECARQPTPFIPSSGGNAATMFAALSLSAILTLFFNSNSSRILLTFDLTCSLLCDSLNFLQERAFLEFRLEFRPYSAFTFGGRNRRPKGENFPFWPKDRNSGRPLFQLHNLKGCCDTL